MAFGVTYILFKTRPCYLLAVLNLAKLLNIWTLVATSVKEK